MSKNILIVVAHSDDETIGMGGTINRHTNIGDNVIAISMTNGVGARDITNLSEIKSRERSAIDASSKLGFKWGDCFDFDDNKMDNYPLLDIVKCIEKVKKEYEPNIVYTHSSSDLNIDHRVISNAVITAFRPQPKEKCNEIRLFEVPSATDFGIKEITGVFSPNLFVGLTKENWESKLNALRSYGIEIREYPHSRSLKSIQNLANLRGNQVGLEMAEAFQIIRKIEF